jgi:phosphoenolpyruvate carboxykinase (GTP)
MGDYFGHWIQIGRMSTADKLPKIFFVNWFRKNDKGKFIWPGYGDNIRALKWVIERVTGEGKFVETPIGRLPAEGALDIEGLDISPEDLKKLFSIEKESGLAEVAEMREYYKKFGDRLPKELVAELDKIEARLKK